MSGGSIISLTITGFEPSDGLKAHLFIVVISTPSGDVTRRTRFSEMYELHTKIKKKVKAPSFPRKTLTSAGSKTSTKRVASLNAYFGILFETYPSMRNDPDVVELFLHREEQKPLASEEEFIISAPSGFDHASHIGWDPANGFDVVNLPESWKAVFASAGIQDEELQDAETAAFIMETVEEAMQQQQLEEEQKEAPPVPSSSDASVATHHGDDDDDGGGDGGMGVSSNETRGRMDSEAPPMISGPSVMAPRPPARSDKPDASGKSSLLSRKGLAPSPPSSSDPGTTTTTTTTTTTAGAATSAVPSAPSVPVAPAAPSTPSPSGKPSSPTSGGGGGGLLSGLQSVKLSKASDRVVPDLAKLDKGQAGSLADTLRQAMIARRGAIQVAVEDVADGEEDDDAEWDL